MWWALAKPSALTAATGMDAPTLAANAMNDVRGFTNPRPATHADIEQIFRAAACAGYTRE